MSSPSRSGPPSDPPPSYVPPITPNFIPLPEATLVEAPSPAFDKGGRGGPLPREFGNYLLLEVIGGGGAGVVFKARQLAPDRLVALKMLRSAELASVEELHRFRDEADRAAALDHPHIVPVYDYGEIDGLHYLSMKLFEGGTLAQHAKEYRTDPRRAVALIATVARAVHHAHQRQLLHRDLKPQNVLLDAGGQPHVADFGLARRLDTQGRTVSGLIVGTPEYMSPEQATAKKQLTTAVDVWGLGAVLYSLLTGRPPFQGGNVLETVGLVVNSEPVPPRSLNDRVPRDVEIICLLCLKKDPARRYGSALALAEDLERYLRGEPITARRASRRERVWAWCRRNPGVAVLSASVAILLVLLTIGSIAAAVGLMRQRDLALDAEKRILASDREQRQQLYKAHLNESRASRASGRGEPGLVAICKILDSLDRDLTDDQRAELRDEVIACLAYTDVKEEARLPIRSARGGKDVACDRECQLVLHGADQESVLSRIADGASLWPVPPLQGSPPPFVTQRGIDDTGRWLTESWFVDWKDNVIQFRVWDRHRKRLVFDEVVRSSLPAFLPDGRQLLVLKREGVLAIYDLIGERWQGSSGPGVSAFAFAVSPDGQRAAIAHEVYHPEIVDLTTWKTVASIPEAGHATRIVWSPPGLTGNDGVERLLIGNRAGQLYQWFPAFGRGFRLLGQHVGPVEHLCVSPDGKYLASFGEDQQCVLRKIPGDMVLQTMRGRALRFSRDGERFVVATPTELITYRLVGGQTCLSHRVPVEGIEFSPDGRWLGLGGFFGATLLDAQTLHHVAQFGLDHCGPVSFRPNGSELVTFGQLSHAWRWPIAAQEGAAPRRIGPPTRVLPPPPPLISWPHHQGRHCVWSKDGTKLVLADYRDHQVWLLDTEKDARPRVLAKLLNVGRVAISPDNLYVAGASSTPPNHGRIWAVADGQVVRELPEAGHVVFSADGRWFATSSARQVQLYRAGTRERHHVFPRETIHHVFGPLAIQADGRLLAYPSARGQLRLCDCETGRVVANLLQPEFEEVSWLAFSPDGTRLAAVYGFGMIAVWDLHDLRGKLMELGLGGEDLPRRDQPVVGGRVPIVVDRGKGLPDPAGWSKQWMLLAVGEAWEGKYNDAIDATTRALHTLRDEATPTERAKILLQRGEYHLQNRKPVAAREDWRAAWALNPALPKLGQLLSRLSVLGPPTCRDAGLAYAILLPLTGKESATAEDHLLLGLALVRLGRAEEGLRCLAKCREENLKPFVGYARALAQHQLKRTREAALALAEAIVAHDRLQPMLSATERDELTELRAEVEGLLGKK